MYLIPASERWAHVCGPCFKNTAGSGHRGFALPNEEKVSATQSAIYSIAIFELSTWQCYTTGLCREHLQLMRGLFV